MVHILGVGVHDDTDFTMTRASARGRARTGLLRRRLVRTGPGGQRGPDRAHRGGRACRRHRPYPGLVGRWLGPAGAPVPEHPAGRRLPVQLRQAQRDDRAASRQLRHRLAIRAGSARGVHGGHARGRRIAVVHPGAVQQPDGASRARLHRGRDGAVQGAAAPGPRRQADHAQGQVRGPGHPGVAETASRHRHGRARHAGRQPRVLQRHQLRDRQAWHLDGSRQGRYRVLVGPRSR